MLAAPTDALLRDCDLAGVEAVDTELPYISSVRAELWRHAQALLARGLHAQTRSEVAVALESMQQLGALHEAVDALTQRSAQEAAQRLTASADARRKLYTPSFLWCFMLDVLFWLSLVLIFVSQNFCNRERNSGPAWNSALYVCPLCRCSALLICVS